ncbi:MAG: hypothetical protein R3284_08685 [Rubricoccaceae bacterium]|nr:hypothetical protein [Rubricoccaceae bacterium]
MFPRRKSYSGPFGWLYRLKDWVESLAERRFAAVTLFVLAFCESIFFPIPVDVLLIALCVSIPTRSFWFAAVCTVGSVLGAFGGYAIGYWLWYEGTGDAQTYSNIATFFFEHLPGFTEPNFEAVARKYHELGFWAIFTGGFTPLPFKVFTISGGIVQLNLITFFIASLLSRAARFFLVAALFYFFGEEIKKFIDKHLGWLSIAFVVLLIAGFVALKYLL